MHGIVVELEDIRFGPRREIEAAVAGLACAAQMSGSAGEQVSIAVDDPAWSRFHHIEEAWLSLRDVRERAWTERVGAPFLEGQHDTWVTLRGSLVHDGNHVLRLKRWYSLIRDGVMEREGGAEGRRKKEDRRRGRP